MKFSGGRINVDSSKVVITKYDGQFEDDHSFEKSTIKDIKLVRTEKPVEVKRWVIAAIALAVLIAAISLSSYLGEIRAKLSTDTYLRLDRIHDVLFPTTIILFFLIIGVEVFADVRVIRRLISNIFKHTDCRLEIYFNDGKKKDISVRNKSEGDKIIKLIRS